MNELNSSFNSDIAIVVLLSVIAAVLVLASLSFLIKKMKEKRIVRKNNKEEKIREARLNDIKLISDAVKDNIEKIK